MHNHSQYPIVASEELETFEFISVGKNGCIDKIIHFQKTDKHSLYNLAFGDKKELFNLDDGQLVVVMDDSVNSENGDRNKVLATVANSVYQYTAVYPERWIIFAGSDEIRTRLYRMAITINYDDLSKDFHIFGLAKINGVSTQLPFDGKTNFSAFIVKRK